MRIFRGMRLGFLSFYHILTRCQVNINKWECAANHPMLDCEGHSSVESCVKVALVATF